MIAAIAEHEGKIVGVFCGASADSPFMWQLGIDVTPEHQGRGLAPALTSTVAEAVLDKGMLWNISIQHPFDENCHRYRVQTYVGRGIIPTI